MVEDAESHATEDQERRKTVEARNQLDTLIYSAEKGLADNKDKLDPEAQGSIQSAVEEAKKALEGDDLAAIEAATKTLTEASHKLAEVMYQQQAADAGPEAGAPAPDAASDGDDDVIDAEYVDTDDSDDTAKAS